MPAPTIQDVLNKLAELEPLSEAKDSAAATKAVKDAEVVTAQENLVLSQAAAATAATDYTTADEAYDAKITEIESLLEAMKSA